MVKCSNESKNFSRCTCTYSSCDYHGLCCECLHSHLKRKELPACCFPPSVEKTYDRSFKRFIQTYQDLK